jgi:formamidopyrimidine-DNA glycosylase
VARISPDRWQRLALSVRATLERALAAGGTTLRDFASAEGVPGEFQVECAVYGREGLPCRVCGAAIRAVRQGQRSTFYCPGCQR